jgi:hypothetical protein
MAHGDRTSHDIDVALIKAVTKLFWPAAFLIILVVFHRQVTDVITMVERQMTLGGASVEVAGIKVSLPKGMQLPPPRSEVAEVLPKFDTQLLKFVLDHPSDTPINPQCPKGKNVTDVSFEDFDPEISRPLTKLEKLKLVSMTTVHQADKTCVGVHFDELYRLTREYLVSILSWVDFAKLD